MVIRAVTLEVCSTESDHFLLYGRKRYAGGNYWIRNYANATDFTLVSYYGDTSKDVATSTYGIRPVFAITGD